MVSQTVMRFVAVLLTLLTISVMEWSEWMAVLWSVAFVHYLLALYYSRRRVVNVGHGRPLLLALVTLAGGWLLYINEFSLLIYFGVHHVFNEVYLTNRAIVTIDVASRRRFVLSSILLNTCIYAVVLRHYPEISWMDDRLLFGLLALSFGAFLSALFRFSGLMPKHEVFFLAAFEILGLALVAVSFFVDIRLNYIVLYHFIFWFFYPMNMFAKRGGSGLSGYLIASIGMLVLFIMMSPISPIDGWDKTLSEYYFTQQFIFWSYLHITLSFIVSDAHPMWIRRAFNPALSG